MFFGPYYRFEIVPTTAKMLAVPCATFKLRRYLCTLRGEKFCFFFFFREFHSAYRRNCYYGYGITAPFIVIVYWWWYYNSIMCGGHQILLIFSFDEELFVYFCLRLVTLKSESLRNKVLLDTPSIFDIVTEFRDSIISVFLFKVSLFTYNWI